MSKAQVLITFDDGTISQYAGMNYIADMDMVATVGVTTGLVNTPGYMIEHELIDLVSEGHCVCSHSAKHLQLGTAYKCGKKVETTSFAVIDDLIKSKEYLNGLGLMGDYCFVPFGTQNIGTLEVLNKLSEYFKWIRLTAGCPIEEDGKTVWSIQGHRRFFPINYSEPVIGITVAGDTRFSGEVIRCVEDAIRTNTMAVIVYHEVNHIYGNNQDIQWEQFKRDIDFISCKAHENVLQCVTPMALLGETYETPVCG